MKNTLSKPFSLDCFLENLGGQSRIRYDLSNFQRALQEAGNPERNVQSIVISGTNGKGSVTLYISSALTEAGFKVMSYLSPHLHHVQERFLLGLKPIDPKTLERLAQAYAYLANTHDLTYFEFLTLLFFVWAREMKPDFIVLEVGLGGRLDATNVTQPLACAITNISMDHEAILGNSLSQIMGEKAGILRPKTPTFTAIDDIELLSQLDSKCKGLEAPLYPLTFAAERQSVTWAGQMVYFDPTSFTLRNPSETAARNACLAYLLLRKVFQISDSTIQAGFSRVATPGRLEVVNESPRVVLSGDHNLAGLETLIRTLQDLSHKRLLILAGFSPDKPYFAMFQRLKQISSEVWLTQITRLKGKYSEDYRKMGPFFENPSDALDYLLSKANLEDTILVTGSLYLVGEIRPRFKNEVRFTFPLEP